METGFRPANYGTNLDPRSGKLFVFEPRRITVAVCWPRPLAWRKSAKLGWRHVRLSSPYFRIPLLDLDTEVRGLGANAEPDGQLRFAFMRCPDEADELARLSWYLRIPPSIRDLIVPFRNRQWHLLSMLARCGTAAAELVASSPALGFALASNWVFHRPAVQRPLRAIRTLLKPGKKQKDILRWLGFPATESARRVLSRVVPTSIDINPLLYLRQALGNPKLMKSLAHAPRLNSGVLRILTDPQLAPLSTPRLIADVGQQTTEDAYVQTAYLLRDAHGMFQQVSRKKSFPRIRSLAELHDVHQELVEKVNSLPPLNLSFPEPPVPGNATIVPIRDAVELWHEGNEMNHCVASYSREIALRKDLFVYKVLGPERCTLSIRKSGSGWRIAELKKSCNGVVSPQTEKQIRHWLAESQS